jgi:thiol-disulfide isomerase/thioredoxin
MNKLSYLFTLLLIFCFFSCHNDKKGNNYNSLIDYNGKTYLKLKVNNCSDTTVIHFQNYTVIPVGIDTGQIIVCRDGVYSLTLKSTHPFLGQLYYRNSDFPVFTIPNDTLEIELDLKLNQDHWNSIKYEGRTEQMNNYYLEKFRHFNYTYPGIGTIATKYLSSTYSIYKGAEKIDSLYNEEQKFFSAYNNKSYLPEWFVEMERLNIYYGNLEFKMGAIPYRNFLNNEHTKANDTYFSFLKSIPIDDPKAYLSLYYFNFLDSYFYIQNMDRYDDTKQGFERAYPILKIDLPNIISELSGDTRKLFLAYSFSKNYSYTNKKSQVLKVDSLFNTVADYIKDSTLINAVKKTPNQKTETSGENSFLDKGEKAPDFYLSDVNGKYYSLKDFKGKLIYLSFWASYCRPCIKNIPAKNDLIKEFENKPIAFINISFDKDNVTWLKCIEKYKVSGIELKCKGNWENILRTNFNINGIPRYVLINKNGEIIDSDAPSPANKSELKSLIDKYLE